MNPRPAWHLEMLAFVKEKTLEEIKAKTKCKVQLMRWSKNYSNKNTIIDDAERYLVIMANMSSCRTSFLMGLKLAL